MFGENLTIEGMDESLMRIGDIYKIGGALVQVSQPREPCYKLGIRFGTQEVLRQFIAHNRPGTYVRILEEGKVHKGDTLDLQEQSENTLSVQQFYELMFAKEKTKEILQLFMSNTSVPQYKKERYKKFL
jgi:MOSC domain-containing protein YiiM